LLLIVADIIYIGIPTAAEDLTLHYCWFPAFRNAT